MKRRDFLKNVASVSALAVCGSIDISDASPIAPQGKPQTGQSQARVVISAVTKGATVAEIKAAVRKSALSASNLSWLSRNDAIFIKPALNSGSAYPSTTSPVAVAAVVALLKEKGARRVIVGDMAGIEHVKLSPAGLTGSTRKLMEASGMAKAVLAAGGELHFFEEAGWNAFYEDPMNAGTHWKNGLMMPSILKEVDHIILMPRCGRHVLAGCTLGMKAAVGYWRTDTRLEYHRDAATFHEKTAEANTALTLIKKQRLVISAADKILTTFGPDQGYVYQPETGIIIASESAIAHDMVSLAWLLENRRHLPADKKDGFIDTSPLVARLANYFVVGKLGGWQPVIASDTLIKNDLKSIWDDRVLNHAYRIAGGAPELNIDTTNNTISAELKKLLTDMTKV
jgi:uncharacterized protein (DUF362 family)